MSDAKERVTVPHDVDGAGKGLWIRDDQPLADVDPRVPAQTVGFCQLAHADGVAGRDFEQRVAWLDDIDARILGIGWNSRDSYDDDGGDDCGS
jgi:hypothetical protein